MAEKLDEQNSEELYNEANEIDKGSVPGKSPRDSFLLCEKAAQLGHVRAMHSLGIKYFFGEGVEVDQKKAFQWWKKAADAGDIMALRDVGVAYELGQGVEVNEKKAQEYFQKAADRAVELGHLDINSAVAIAMLIDEQHIPGKGPEDSFDMFKAAATAGNPYAMRKVGYKYFYGIGVQQNIEEALNWWNKAADAGNVEALFDLGLSYQFGHGVEIDIQKAIELYQRASDKGNIYAKTNLAGLYAEKNSEQYDAKKAFNLASELAELGVGNGMRILADLYLEGVGCEQDMQKAYSLYEQAANNGCPGGWYDMAVMLENGSIVSETDNYIDLYKKAADAGIPDAQCRLGIEYLYGKNKNIEEGLKRMEEASEGGMGLASYDLARLFYQGDIVPKDLSKAKKYAQQAVEQGYAEGQEILDALNDSIITKIRDWFVKFFNE